METWKFKAHMNRLRAISPEQVERFRALSMNEQNIEIEAYWYKGTGKSIRIWHYWNGTHTRLTLRPGKTITLYRCERHSEGWSAEEDRITLNEDGTVTMESVNDGTDCDGRLTRETTYIMSGLIRVDYEQQPSAVMQKAGIEASWSVMVPNWTQSYSRQSDEYAEAAGY